MNASMPLYHVGRCMCSFGEWTLSLGNPIPTSTDSTPQICCSMATAPMEQVLIGGPHLLLLTRPEEAAREIVRFVSSLTPGSETNRA